MAEPLKLLSSMATRLLLAEMVGRYRLERGVAVELEAVGGSMQPGELPPAKWSMWSCSRRGRSMN